MTQNLDGFMRAMLVLPFVQYVEQRGKNTKPVLKAMGMDKRMLQDPKATVHAEIVYGFFNALADHAEIPHLGCQVGEQFDLTDGSPMAVAARESRTVLEFLCNYLRSVPQETSSVKHALNIEADKARYSVRRLVNTRNLPRHADGFGIALHLRLLSLAVGSGWAPDQVMIETAFPEAVPRGYMGVRFAKTENPELVLSFPSSWLQAGLELDVAVKKLRETGGPSDLTLIAALRTAALPLLEKKSIGLQDLSEALGLEPKRLEAALRLQKTTVAQEIKNLRIEQAKEALSNSSLTVAEIGRSLGYEDQSHFARFFRSQTGLSPLQFREHTEYQT